MLHQFIEPKASGRDFRPVDILTCYNILYILIGIVVILVFKKSEYILSNVNNSRAFITLTKYLFIYFQALVGTTLSIPTLDGRKVPVRISEVIKPTSTRRIQGEGLPYPKQPTRKGDMIVEFDIVFPNTLTASVTETLANTLPRTSYS